MKILQPVAICTVIFVTSLGSTLGVCINEKALLTLSKDRNSLSVATLSLTFHPSKHSLHLYFHFAGFHQLLWLLVSLLLDMADVP